MIPQFTTCIVCECSLEVPLFFCISVILCFIKNDISKRCCSACTVRNVAFCFTYERLCALLRQTLAGSESEEKFREALQQKDSYIIELEHYISSLQQTLSSKNEKIELVVKNECVWL